MDSRYIIDISLLDRHAPECVLENMRLEVEGDRRTVDILDFAIQYLEENPTCKTEHFRVCLQQQRRLERRDYTRGVDDFIRMYGPGRVCLTSNVYVTGIRIYGKAAS